MIKYVTNYRQPCVKVNTDTLDVVECDHICSDIDWTYEIDEDGVFKMGDVEKEVKKGDIVIKFYENRNYGKQIPFIVVRDEDWMKRREAFREHLKELDATFSNTEISDSDIPCAPAC
jgi:hypothetical protein